MARRFAPNSDERMHQLAINITRYVYQSLEEIKLEHFRATGSRISNSDALSRLVLEKKAQIYAERSGK